MQTGDAQAGAKIVQALLFVAEVFAPRSIVGGQCHLRLTVGLAAAYVDHYYSEFCTAVNRETMGRKLPNCNETNCGGMRRFKFEG